MEDHTDYPRHQLLTPIQAVSRSISHRIQTRSATRASNAHKAALLLTPRNDVGDNIPLLTPAHTVSRYGGRGRQHSSDGLIPGLVPLALTSMLGPRNVVSRDITPPLTPPRVLRRYKRGRKRASLRSATPDTSLLNPTLITMPSTPSPQDRSATAEKTMLFEVQAIIEEQEKLLAQKDMQIQQHEQQLGKIVKTWKSENVCYICHDHMKKPFMIRECGHHFCGPCLRSWCSKQLEDRLKEIPFIFFYTTANYNPYKAPASKKILQRTLHALRIDGKKPENFFYYSCPLCKIKVHKTPVDSVIARTMLCGVVDALVGRPELLPTDRVDESRVDGAAFFDGLFLTKYNPDEYV